MIEKSMSHRHRKQHTVRHHKSMVLGANMHKKPRPCSTTQAIWRQSVGAATQVRYNLKRCLAVTHKLETMNGLSILIIQALVYNFLSIISKNLKLRMAPSPKASSATLYSGPSDQF